MIEYITLYSQHARYILFNSRIGLYVCIEPIEVTRRDISDPPKRSGITLWL